MNPLYFVCFVLIFSREFANVSAQVPFSQFFVPSWGQDHITFTNQERQAQILIDQHSGGGFVSKKAFGSGYFQMSLQMPQNSKGLVTTIYLTSSGGENDHDELDFELLGGPPYILNTNVFAQDSGNREQQFKLWFDPTQKFHDYAILWNQHQIVFLVDTKPIRVFENKENIGAKFPKLPMQMRASLWNATKWLGPIVDWRKGPFLAHFSGFDLSSACPYDSSSPITKCYASNYPWNKEDNWHLSPEQERIYQNLKAKYMTYDYCKSKPKGFPECLGPH